MHNRLALFKSIISSRTCAVGFRQMAKGKYWPLTSKILRNDYGCIVKQIRITSTLRSRSNTIR